MKNFARHNWGKAQGVILMAIMLFLALVVQNNDFTVFDAGIKRLLVIILWMLSLMFGISGILEEVESMVVENEKPLEDQEEEEAQHRRRRRRGMF